MNGDDIIEQSVTQEYITIIEGRRELFGEMIERIISLISNTFYQDATMNVISGKVIGYEKYKCIEEIKEFLRYDKGFGKEYDFFFYGFNGISFYKADTIFKDITSFKDSYWYKEAMGSDSFINWFGVESTDVTATDAGGKKIFLASMKLDISISYDEHVEGLGFFSIDETILDDLFKGVSGTIYLVDTQGRIVYDSSKQMLDKNVSVLGIDSKEDMPINSQYNVKQIDKKLVDGRANNIAIISTKDAHGLSIIHIREHLPIMVRYKYLQYMIYIAYLVIMAFVIYYAIMYRNWIGKPIKKLNNMISKMNTDSKSQAEGQNNNIASGIKRIDYEFNKIFEENKNILQKISKIEAAEQLMEIKKLQAEIDPHFLYNILSHVKFAAMLNNPEQIIKMIDCLFVILKIKKGQVDNFIPVNEEIDTLEKYIDIIKLLYQDNIEFNIDVDDSIKDYYIPAFILQPIVENCVHHGTDPSTKGGRINIVGKIVDDNIVFEISDNGKGIQKEALSKIIQYQKDMNASKNEHMGIMNIDKKIKLCCGNEYGITMESIIGQGTKVIVKLSLDMDIDSDISLYGPAEDAVTE
jgi:two-component system sensor histidine kinase YesM